MADRVADDEVIARYLLGELPAEEQTELEQRYFADPALLDRIDAVEDDLIDEYVRDELTPEQREHFEARFLDEKRLERVRMADALRRAAEGRGASAVPRVDAARSRRRSLFALPLAAALFGAALLTIVWLALENRALSARVETLRAEREQAVAQNAEWARRAAQRETPPQPAPKPPDVPPAPIQLATIVLAPGLSRAGDDISTLVIERHASAVRLEALLEVEAERYDATLQRTGGAVVWSGSGLAPRTVRGEPRLVVTVPRDRFRSGEHLLTITAPGLVADYAFHVVVGR